MTNVKQTNYHILQCHAYRFGVGLGWWDFSILRNRDYRVVICNDILDNPMLAMMAIQTLPNQNYKKNRTQMKMY